MKLRYKILLLKLLAATAIVPFLIRQAHTDAQIGIGVLTATQLSDHSHIASGQGGALGNISIQSLNFGGNTQAPSSATILRINTLTEPIPIWQSLGSNDFIGVHSTITIHTGTSNLGVGRTSLDSVTSGINNVGIGSSALYTLTTGSRNTALGVSALSSITTAGFNTALGGIAGQNLNSGNYNTFIGYSSAFNNSGSGSNNTLIGAREISGNPAGTYGSGNVSLGFNAGLTETGSNILHIHNSSTTPSLIWGNFSTGRIGHYSPTFDFFLSTAVGGTDYVQATPSSTTFRHNVVIGTGNSFTTPNITLASQGTITGSTFAVILSSSITNTTSEIDLYSTTINANTLGSQGCIKVKGVYTQTEANANNKTIRIYYGSSLINSDVLTTADARAINHITCNTNNTSAQRSWNSTANNNSTITTTTIDSTTNQTYRITGQLQVASDTMTWTHGFLEVIK